MLGLMQHHPLLLSSVIAHAARHHPRAEVVSVELDGTRHRSDYATVERRSRQLLTALTSALSVQPGERVVTLAWNTHRHLELYYGISGLGAVCHTVNPRLPLDDIAYIMTDAGNRVVFADLSFVPLLEQLAPRLPALKHAVLLCAKDAMPAEVAGLTLHAYEDLVEAASPADAWPVFDENTASALCYTSGTTGRPKGVLYSHRSAILHAMACNFADLFALRATDRAMPGSSMFHVTGWGVPYAAPMVGAALVMPGRHLDPASLVALIEEEGATFATAVPTVWLGVLAEMQGKGIRPRTLRRIACGGSAVPRVLIEGLGALGVEMQQAWGMTETSPVMTYQGAVPATAGLAGEDHVRLRLRQGRAVFGADVKIVDGEGAELPWDGKAFGDLLARGHWVAERYYQRGEEGAADAEGWFRTGDVATIDANGYAELVDRSKDVIKSGGEWISSIALENIAVSHPDVAEAAVIAAKHPKWMERPLLLVVPKQGKSVTPESVMALYGDQVPRWWLPDAVVVVDELPHTATGKLNKLALRATWEGHLEKQA
jgi:acyl-CoA synthetase (AMP-forming)/AMP-acid ligase II